MTASHSLLSSEVASIAPLVIVFLTLTLGSLHWTFLCRSKRFFACNHLRQAVNCLHGAMALLSRVVPLGYPLFLYQAEPSTSRNDGKVKYHVCIALLHCWFGCNSKIHGSSKPINEKPANQGLRFISVHSVASDEKFQMRRGRLSGRERLFGHESQCHVIPAVQCKGQCLRFSTFQRGRI